MPNTTNMIFLADDAGVQTRAKRRSIAVLGNDENENPFITRTPSVAPSKPISTRSSISPVQSRPAKHGAPQSRVATTTPSGKISALFSVTKSASSVDILKDTNRTPQTPRHRDALSNKVAITPRHRIQISNSPATPRSPSTPSFSASNVYIQARQLFATCTDPAILVGRDVEKTQLSTFISDCIHLNHGGCLYISGPPGTGKSAFVESVSQEFTTTEAVAMATVNCMSVKSAKDLAVTLCDGLDIAYDSTRGADFDFIRTRFLAEQGQTTKYLVVLDEIDRLVDLDLKLLYSLFEWSMQPASRLILVGIANALDLTDRFLPRLKSRFLKPTLLPFMPYTAPQIAQILTSKLQTLAPNPSVPAFVPFLHPAAIQFISKKVSSQTGDLRKAFDICHRAIALAESEAKANIARMRLEQASPSKSTQATPLMENINLASPPAAKAQTPLKQTTISLTSSLSHLTVETAPRATIAHAAKITAQVFSNGASQRLSHLNIQQKAVLCSLSALENKKHTSPSSNTVFATPTKKTEVAAAPTIKALYETYTLLCKRDHLLHPLTSVEFRDVVSGLETLSLINQVDPSRNSSSFFAKMPMTPSRTPSRKGKNAGGGFVGSISGDEKRMATCVSFAEVEAAVKTGAGSEILQEILRGAGI